MAQLSIAFCRQLAQARREKGMTQSAVAEAVGCKQSAISMLEAGQSAKIAQETVEKIAALLEVPLPVSESRPPVPAPSPLGSRAFCPSVLCFSNVPYMVDGRLFFWQQPQPGGTHCAVCGELLERRCPQCGAPVYAAGGCCLDCGDPRITDTLSPEADRATWAAQRQREITEWRALTGV